MKNRTVVVSGAAGIVLAASVFAWSRGEQRPAPGPAAAQSPNPKQPAIVRVEPAQVCMVNDRDMRTPQIPVEVEGRTYYGCCPMCKQRIAADRGIRRATDPVTGRTVDKAAAVIGRLPDGGVLYFEDEANLTRYAKGGGKTGERP